LTLALVLRDAASDPYQSTREATNGPDVVASVSRPAERSGLEELAGAAGVIDHSGPYPVTPAELQASGRTSDVQAVGRDAAPASVDQPELLQGSWVSDGGVVVEAAFANALDVRVGDPVTLDGRSFEVVGVAVTAAMPPFPGASCMVAPGCASGASPEELSELPPGLLQNPGLVWLTQADVRSLTPDPGSLAYVMNLKLADPDEAQAFVGTNQAASRAAPNLQPWENILEEATELAGDAQILLLIGAWLLGLLAVASLSVLVGGRMADQTRRVGLLKAVGGTPSLVAAVLLAEYVLVAIVAAAAGLAVGSLTAPLLTESGAGLIGSAGTPPMTMSTVGLVTAVALGVAVAATVVPAVRAARSSTVNALADSARPPRRSGWLIAVSARLPVPLLLALRIAARRPRRVVLGVVSIAITVSGIYVALVLDAFLTTQPLASGYDDAQVELLRQVLLVVMVILLSLAAVNAIFIAWATVLDNRHSSALARALGATPREVSAALAAAQVLPALVGAVLGVFPGGLALFAAINAITGGDSDRATLPSLWQRLAVVPATVLVVAALTAVPARLGGRRPVTETLQAELA
jgi:ABC-type lipoprotein release transport system permease subunit